MTRFDGEHEHPIPERTERSWNVLLRTIPHSLEQLLALPEASLLEPQGTAALAAAALSLYADRPAQATELLNFLKGPRPLGAHDLQLLQACGRDGVCCPAAYFLGATPENDYQPGLPYTVVVSEDAHSRDRIEEGYQTLYLRAAGSDAPRPITLRRKSDTGQWFVWEFEGLLAPI